MKLKNLYMYVCVLILIKNYNDNELEIFQKLFKKLINVNLFL